MIRRTLALVLLLSFPAAAQYPGGYGYEFRERTPGNDKLIVNSPNSITTPRACTLDPSRPGFYDPCVSTPVPTWTAAPTSTPTQTPTASNTPTPTQTPTPHLAYERVLDQETPLPKQRDLNFEGDGVSCTDDSTQTTCTITGAGGGGGGSPGGSTGDLQINDGASGFDAYAGDSCPAGEFVEAIGSDGEATCDTPAGGGAPSIVTVTSAGSPYTVLGTEDVIVCNTTSGPITLNLPALAGATKIVRIKKPNNTLNDCTIDGNSSETIDGRTTHVLEWGLEEATLVPVTGGWQIVGAVKPYVWVSGANNSTAGGAATAYFPVQGIAALSGTEAPVGFDMDVDMMPVYFGCALYGGAAGGSGYTITVRINEATDTDWSISIGSGSQVGTDISGSEVAQGFSITNKIVGTTSANARQPRCTLVWYALG